jgi:hypothetical protein
MKNSSLEGELSEVWIWYRLATVLAKKKDSLNAQITWLESFASADVTLLLLPIQPSYLRFPSGVRNE